MDFILQKPSAKCSYNAAYMIYTYLQSIWNHRRIKKRTSPSIGRIKIKCTWHDFQLHSKGRTTVALFLSFYWYQSNFYEIWVFQLWDHCWLLSKEGHPFARETSHTSSILPWQLWANPSQRCLELSCFSEATEKSSHICFCTYLLHSHSLVISAGGSARILIQEDGAVV